jgi:hypothetical protein
MNYKKIMIGLILFLVLIRTLHSTRRVELREQGFSIELPSSMFRNPGSNHFEIHSQRGVEVAIQLLGLQTYDGNLDQFTIWLKDHLRSGIRAGSNETIGTTSRLTNTSGISINSFPWNGQRINSRSVGIMVYTFDIGRSFETKKIYARVMVTYFGQDAVDTYRSQIQHAISSIELLKYPLN